MGRGVVPDGGVFVNGVEVDPRDSEAHMRLNSKDSLAEVDTSNAYKKVGDTTYNRSNYTSDEEFSKAIYKAFYKSAASSVKNFDKLDAVEKEVVIDFGYNGGTESFKFNDIALLVTELQKPVEDRKVANLVKFTQNIMSDGKNMRGLLRRRALGANKILSAKDQIAYIEQGEADKNGKVLLSMKRSDGTTVQSWSKANTTSINVGESILTIDGQRMSKYIAPKTASVDLTNWSEAIT
tara:strand:- start:6 stop:716 length:711 start_codon:yes stop_codon:yes gene_type:complete